VHSYKFDDDTYPSVTGILGQLSKGDALLQWAANQAVGYIEENSYKKLSSDNTGNVYTADQETLDLAKTAFKDYREKTADLGSELHSLIEIHINAQLNEKELNDDLLKDQFDPRVWPMYLQFKVWEKNNVSRWLESEKPVFSYVEGFAGTCDMIFEDMNGNIVLCDLKTSNSIYKEAELQVSAYKAARQFMKGGYNIGFSDGKATWNKEIFYHEIKIDKCAVLNISRDYFDLKYKVVKDPDTLYEAFLGLVKYYYYSAKRRVKNQITKELY